jgi:hypothetical protein
LHRRERLCYPTSGVDLSNEPHKVGTLPHIRESVKS